MWYIYTKEYYSAIKKSEIMPFAATWMDLGIIILNKVRQRKTGIIWYLFMYLFKKWDKWTYLQNRNWVTDIEDRHYQEPAWEIPPMTRSCEGDLTSKASGLKGLPGQIPPMTKVMRKRPDGQRWIRTRGTPWTCSSIYPQTRIYLSYYFMPFTNSSDINRGLSPTTFFWKKLT